MENGYGKPSVKHLLTETDTETETDSRHIFTHELKCHVSQIEGLDHQLAV